MPIAKKKKRTQKVEYLDGSSQKSVGGPSAASRKKSKAYGEAVEIITVSLQEEYLDDEQRQKIESLVQELLPDEKLPTDPEVLWSALADRGARYSVQKEGERQAHAVLRGMALYEWVIRQPDLSGHIKFLAESCSWEVTDGKRFNLVKKVLVRTKDYNVEIDGELKIASKVLHRDAKAIDNLLDNGLHSYEAKELLAKCGGGINLWSRGVIPGINAPVSSRKAAKLDAASQRPGSPKSGKKKAKHEVAISTKEGKSKSVKGRPITHAAALKYFGEKHAVQGGELLVIGITKDLADGYSSIASDKVKLSPAQTRRSRGPHRVLSKGLSAMRFATVHMKFKKRS
jgi:hypothetical protein